MFFPSISPLTLYVYPTNERGRERAVNIYLFGQVMRSTLWDD